MWIPRHCNITGNEKADEVAKLSHTSLKAINVPGFTYCDAKKHIKNFYAIKWQQYWSNQSTKLNEVKKSILPWPTPPGCSRRQETILNRLRIGHTLLTHRYLMTREDPPNCTTCGVQLTIKHIFKECRNNQQERMETLGATHLHKILSPEPTATQKLFIFLKKSTLFKEILPVYCINECKYVAM
ncbi:putative RNA-directed DNA polymerase [Aphis craccivora]|uniref:Putative RNA-directed DNA polymerase n=1 Tax=Aphis craccivora TaxID=307492 RepID=A0A6G0VPF5_APHCR|nr:putative RNA-directed DNA polymerase [Aphis craccivora]